ncbi:MAG TPA: hypothetical protein VI935_10185 [Thermodesulfobacteriota bacterium]|nr:hypothetical protein [Thermodesulfobacteriota bacterium]
MKKQLMRRRKEIIPKKKLTSEMVIEKLDSIITRLDIIEKDLRELKGIVQPGSEEEKKHTPEFFMEK